MSSDDAFMLAHSGYLGQYDLAPPPTFFDDLEYFSDVPPLDWMGVASNSPQDFGLLPEFSKSNSTYQYPDRHLFFNF